MSKQVQTSRLLLSLTIVLGAASFAQAAITVTTTVDSHAGPWNWNASLNASYDYGVNDHYGPTIIDESDGLSFAAGNTLTIEYISGLVDAFNRIPNVDADGHIGSGYVNGDPGTSGNYFPSYYMDYSGGNNIYLMALVGTFADSSGNIVGDPFAIGASSKDVEIPVGAQQLQLGVNDDKFYDNRGSFEVQITGEETCTTVPAPGAAWLLGSGLIGVFGARLRRNRN